MPIDVVAMPRVHGLSLARASGGERASAATEVMKSRLVTFIFEWSFFESLARERITIDGGRIARGYRPVNAPRRV